MGALGQFEIIGALASVASAGITAGTNYFINQENVSFQKKQLQAQNLRDMLAAQQAERFSLQQSQGSAVASAAQAQTIDTAMKYGMLAVAALVLYKVFVKK